MGAPIAPSSAAIPSRLRSGRRETFSVVAKFAHSAIIHAGAMPANQMPESNRSQPVCTSRVSKSAPIAYFGGSRLGALELTDLAPALAAVGAGWLLLTPVLFVAARRLDGYERS